jgi:hypothetical protein
VIRIILIGTSAVVAFDVAVSLLLLGLGGSLIWMFLGEGLIYLATGFAGGRIGGLGAGARCGALVAIGTGQVSRLTLTAWCSCS